MVFQHDVGINQIVGRDLFRKVQTNFSNFEYTYCWSKNFCLSSDERVTITDYTNIFMLFVLTFSVAVIFYLFQFLLVLFLNISIFIKLLTLCTDNTISYIYYNFQLSYVRSLHSRLKMTIKNHLQIGKMTMKI